MAWLPPLFLGASAAIASEVALGILLYAGEGLMRSLSTTLVVEAASFAAGLAMAPEVAPDLVERLRRRWLFCLLAFLAAAFFGTSWAVLQEMGATALTQGAGLALMAALPLYAVGAVLSGASVMARTEGGGVAPGVPAAFGAAIGFGATGYFLARAPLPSSLLIGCLIMLSLGGMIYGVVLAGREESETKATRSWSGGDVRVEDRRIPSHKRGSRTLYEGSVVRRRATLDGAGTPPWDVAIARSLMPPADRTWRILLVGGGASSLPRTVRREHPQAYVDVLERLAAVVELGREYFETELSVGTDERTRVVLGNLEDRARELNGDYDLVVVDTAALASLGGSSGLSRRTRAILAEHVGRDGVLAWGPVVDGVTEPMPGWYVVEGGRTLPGGPGDDPVTETVLVMSRHAPPVLNDPEGFSPPAPRPTGP